MPMQRMTRGGRFKKLSRVLVFGPPNSFKTTAAVLTSVYPMVIVSVPGEHGWGTIPDNVPGLISLVWETVPGDPVSSESIIREVDQAVTHVIAGKYDGEFGKIRTLVIDGYHKMYNLWLNVATGGSYNAGEEFEARLYTKAHRRSDAFLDKCLDSALEFVTFTTWNAKEQDKPGLENMNGPKHEWPDLPGRAAKEMVGKFSVVCMSRVTTKQVEVEGGAVESVRVGHWGLKPDSEVWGNSVKMDPRMVAQLPKSCPQDFKGLYRIVRQAQEQVDCAGGVGEPR